MVIGRVRRLAGRAEELVYRVRAKREREVERACGFDLYLPPSVLNPRLFKTGMMLAEIVERELGPEERVLDLGSGSGIVGLAAARAGALVWAADKNPVAVRATRINAMLNGLAIEAIESDLFEHVPETLRFDIIAFNPPFFARPQGGALEMALSDGPGLPTLDRFCAECRNRHASGGRALIAGSSNGALSLMRRLYEQHGLTWRTIAERERISERLVIDELR
jgi:release factor glutamine methyltransferase